MERVISALEMGYTPVVVVSAMGKAGQPYATDTLLEMVHSVNPGPNPRNTDCCSPAVRLSRL